MTGFAKRITAHDWRGTFHILTRTHLRALALLTLLATLVLLPGINRLQPMDRDEPRFAQATKQMLETRDFVDIRFQDEARHKKPVGIYWLQAAAVSLGEQLGIDDARRSIGLYRIPSFLGALSIVLLTYWAALAFLSRQGALLAALMMAASVLLGVEARLAKTDAVLGALCVAAMGFLARAYLSSKAPGIAPALNRNHLILFWLVIGASVLVKGPITAAIVALSLVVLAVRDRSLSWFGGMKPWMGLAIVLALAAPWFAMILMKSGWGFIEESLMKDMVAKVGSAQEKHGAPPGTYLGVFWVTFWPAAPLAILAAAFAWRERRDDGVAFLLAWIVPFWLILEAVPTKLPHYVLPLYPALAILIVLAMERSGLMLRRWALWLGAVLFLLVPTVFLIGTPVLFLVLEEGAIPLRLPFLALPFLLVAFALGIFGAVQLVRGRPVRMLMAGMLASLTLSIGAYNFGLPMLKAFNLSPRLAAAAAATGCANPAYATVGYREPSLVFKTDTEILMAKPEEAAAFIDAPGVGCRIAFVERQFEDAFRAGLKGQSAPALATRVRGVNINAALDKQRRLRVLDIAVYVRR